MPTPTSQPLLQALGSPVPAQIVRWSRSLGSRARADVFCWAKEPDMKSQSGPSYFEVLGSSTARALSVFHTPPLVAAIHIVQLSRPDRQSGEITPATVRPPKFSVPVV